MALPWTAPNYGLGIDPARAPFFVPGTVSPALIDSIVRSKEFQQEQNRYGLQEAMSGIHKYMEQKQQDDIANQLMAQQGAQKATPVTPDTLYGEPNQVLSSQEQAQNQSLGYPTTPGEAPDRGGLFGFRLQQAAQKNQYQQALEQARTQHLMNLGYGGGGTGTGRPYYDYTDPNSGQTVKVTGNRFTQLNQGAAGRQFKPAPDPYANLAPVARGTTVTQGDLNEGGRFAGRKDLKVGDWTNAYTGAEQGESLKMKVLGGKAIGSDVFVPYQAYAGRTQNQVAPAGRTVAPGTSLPVTEAFAQGKAAEAAGAPHNAVVQRLKDAGYDTTNY